MPQAFSILILCGILFGMPRWPVRTAEERFWSYVEKLPNDGCWLWTSTKNTNGYGVFYSVGRMELAHRYAWKLEHGSIPEGADVLHKCDTRKCVRHLFTGTHQDNMRDMMSKGRQVHGDRHRQRMREVAARGERNGNSKLKTAQVIEILRRGRTGESQRVIAADFGVGQYQISRILSGKRWAALQSGG